MKSWTWQRRRIVHAAALHVAALNLVGAQPSRQPENNTGDQCSPLMVLIIVVFFIAAFFFMGFFSIYIHQCSNSQPYRRAAAARGLNPSVIETFPTLSYSEVKDQCRALECTVCLKEFEVNETLRLLPKCNHIFHPECVGAWLKFHITCPVCRANLDPLAGHEPVRATQPWHTNDMESELGFQGPESGR